MSVAVTLEAVNGTDGTTITYGDAKFTTNEDCAQSLVAVQPYGAILYSAADGSFVTGKFIEVDYADAHYVASTNLALETVAIGDTFTLNKQ